VSAEERLLRAAYEAFNARDIEAALALVHPEVDWPNGIEGGENTATPPSGTSGRGSSR
jgi:hypothetical protein